MTQKPLICESPPCILNPAAPPDMQRASMNNRPATSHIRYSMLLLTMMVAIMLYLDRICLSIAGESVQKSLQLSDWQIAWLHSAFFWSYALFQLPAGWIGDRWGARRILTIYVILWSACTGLMGLAQGFVVFFLLRLGCGTFEAGAYPVAAGIVSKWMPPSEQGKGSSIVAVGGRLGGAIAPVLTTFLMASAAGLSLNWLAQGPWRLPFLIYGLIGIVLGIIFWLWFRDSPREHASVSEQEANYIQSGSHIKKEQIGAPPLTAMLTSLPLWLNSFVQFTSNFCWVFIITLFPKYLGDVFKTSTESQAWMQAIPLYAGIVGMLCGGWALDALIRRVGKRWGYAISLSVSRLLLVVAFLVSAFLGDAWSMTAAMALVALGTDLGIAAVWGYSQAVGGRYTGSILGWGNMWGNLGSAVSPLVFTAIRDSFDNKSNGWVAVFLVCALLQLLAAFASLGINGEKRLENTASQN